MGKRGEVGMDVGRKREIMYLSLHRHHHFNVSVGSDGQSHETVSTNHNLFVEKGEPKRCQTEVLPLTSLMPYCQAKRLTNTWPFGQTFYI